MLQALRKEIHFETHTIPQRVLHVVLLPILTAIPASLLQKVLRRSSRDADHVTRKGGSAFALEVMYTRHNRSLFSRGFFQGLADYVWHHVISQPMAARNRLRIVEAFFERVLQKNAERDEIIEILTIGGGSSRALVHAIKKLHGEGLHLCFHVVNIDKSAKIAELGKVMLVKEGLEHYIPSFTWITGDARRLQEVLPNGYRANVVEMVGLLDYFNDETALTLFKSIKEVLVPGGEFIVGNICPHNEVKFIQNSGWPDMIYRTSPDLRDLVKSAGFEGDRIKIITEPLGIHTIAIA